MQSKTKVLQNSDVHLIGIVSMYVASKYEDIFPLNSYTAYEKISHKQIPQKELLRKEAEFLTLFDFDLEVATAYDIHSFLNLALEKRVILDSQTKDLLSKVSDLSLYFIRMTLENIDYLNYDYSLLVVGSFMASIKLIKKKYLNDKFYNQLCKSIFELTEM